MSEIPSRYAPRVRSAAERRDLMSYVWGLALALVLTLVPFAMVQWHWAAHTALMVTIGVLALIQVVVHFRFFLHIGLKRKREDLWLILFSASLLIIMVFGTIWIMVNLAARMAIPM
ncbi:MAG: Cytochrome O ubiquinol oxidase subunit IV [Burkholderiaceae bacterium]|jgi:cytochrome o ubiquinol oxidase operon protein cyoD|nr:MAG: Cytochrome O ubiquinol oxidase subunit IV [Burkholderiaceae bacterium]